MVCRPSVRSSPGALGPGWLTDSLKSSDGAPRQTNRHRTSLRRSYLQRTSAGKAVSCSPRRRRPVDRPARRSGLADPATIRQIAIATGSIPGARALTPGVDLDVSLLRRAPGAETGGEFVPSAFVTSSSSVRRPFLIEKHVGTYTPATGHSTTFRHRRNLCRASARPTSRPRPASPFDVPSHRATDRQPGASCQRRGLGSRTPCWPPPSPVRHLSIGHALSRQRLPRIVEAGARRPTRRRAFLLRPPGGFPSMATLRPPSRATLWRTTVEVTDGSPGRSPRHRLSPLPPRSSSRL
jgi:hypothetical protein